MGQIAVVEYETSLGFQVLEFDNRDNISSEVNEEGGVVYIYERQENERYNKELAVINLKSFVSFYKKEVK